MSKLLYSVLLTLLIFPIVLADGLEPWGCCVPPAGECFDGSAFGDEPSFQGACSAAGGNVEQPGVVFTCGTFAQCEVGCCCAGPDVFDSPTINSDENLLHMTQQECSLRQGGTFNFVSLPPGSTCVAECGGDVNPPGGGDTFTVSGTVTNSSGGNTLPNADVYVFPGAISDVTDSAGAFTLLEVPGDYVTLVADHPDCRPGQSTRILVDQDLTGQDIALDCSPVVCSPNNPSFIDPPSNVRGKDEIEFTADVIDVCQNLLQYEPLRCDSNFGNCVNLPPSSSGAFTDGGLQPETTYCYILRARFSTGDVTESTQDSGACVTTGNAECMENTAPEWCGVAGQPPISAKLRCDENNQLVVNPCANNTVCSEQFGGPECVPIPPCELCNGLLGLFARNGYSVSLDGITEQACNLVCNLDSAIGNRPLLIDAYSACLSVSDCSQYRNPNSCTTDLCNVDDSCQWITVNQELGQGVCQGEVPSCESCEDVFGYCNAEMCGVISPDCYFDAEPNELTEALGCVSKDKMSCRRYDTMQDCVGTSNDAVYNINYDTEGNRASGDNSRTTSSDDILGIGACTWVDEMSKCIKDADMQLSQLKEDDCIENHYITEDIECLADATPPETMFYLNNFTTPPSHSRVSIRTLPFSVADDKTPLDLIETYVCFQSQDEPPCYPKDTLSSVALPPEGVYKLRYYSIDASMNSEIVKEEIISINDTHEPAIEDITIQENT